MTCHVFPEYNFDCKPLRETELKIFVEAHSSLVKAKIARVEYPLPCLPLPTPLTPPPPSHLQKKSYRELDSEKISCRARQWA